jgi:hypothetical protein
MQFCSTQGDSLLNWEDQVRVTALYFAEDQLINHLKVSHCVASLQFVALSQARQFRISPNLQLADCLSRSVDISLAIAIGLAFC